MWYGQGAYGNLFLWLVKREGRVIVLRSRLCVGGLLSTMGHAFRVRGRATIGARGRNQFFLERETHDNTTERTRG
jgi:hypothetical protein